MGPKKNIFAIVGSASDHSSNLRLLEHIAELTQAQFEVTIFNDLRALPHFSPELSLENTPDIIRDFRDQVAASAGVLICTPEYIFSIPSILKNAIEWCVSTTVFSHKPTGIITASAHGVKGHEELQLIMKTVEADFTKHTTLLIQGIKGKIDESGNITDAKTEAAVATFVMAFADLVNRADS